MKTAPPTMVSMHQQFSRRSFGEVLSTNTAITENAPSTADSNDGMIFTLSTRLTATCSSVDSTETLESASVAQLRSRLNEWGNKNQNHQHQTLKGSSPVISTNTTTGISASTSHGPDRPPRRPIVRPSTSHELIPTPLPPAAAHALAKRMTQTAPNVLNTASIVVTSGNNIHARGRFDTSIGNNSSMPSSATCSKTSNVASFRARSTPIRFRVPVISAAEASNVQATNEGYASVAELSRWLADDPTSTKKTLRHLRRGANIIAKSRKFDKVLANIVIVEETIPRDCVSKQKEKLLKWSSHSHPEATIKETIYENRQAFNNMGHKDDDDDVSVQSMSQLPSTQKDWMMLGTTSSASVADKKKWLTSAFPTSAAKSTCHITAANSHQPQQFQLFSSTQSDIGLAVSSDLGNRAKDQWRRNRSPIKPTSVYSSRSSLSLPLLQHRDTIPTQVSTDSSDAVRTKADLETQPDAVIEESDMEIASDIVTEVSIIGCVEETDRNDGCVEETDRSDAGVPTNTSTSQMHPMKSADDVQLDFRLARDLVVQRSKANRNVVEVVSAVTRRGSMLEMLEKDAQPKTSGHCLYKSSWEGTKEGYVKKCMAKK